MSSPELPTSCRACTNTFELSPNTDQTERRCPFCQNIIWPEDRAAKEQLKTVCGFEIVRRVESEAEAAVFEATKDVARYLITFLDCGDPRHSAYKTHRERGSGAGWAPFPSIGPHPNILHEEPIHWDGDAAVLAIEYVEGQTLSEWLDNIEEFEPDDVVRIGLACAKTMLHGGEQVRSCIRPKEIYVTSDGRTLITEFAQFARDFRGDPAKEIYGMPRAFDDPAIHARSLRKIQLSATTAPELCRESRTFERHELSNEERQRAIIFSLGGMMYSLLTLKSLPMFTHGVQAIKELAWVPANEFNPAVSKSLAEVVCRMTAFRAQDRYQSFDELIEALDPLQPADPKVSFIHQAPSTAEQSDSVQENTWITRTDGCDFRRMRWGMTQAEIRESEPRPPTSVLPGNLFFDTNYEGLGLSVVYQFVDENDEVICVAASLQTKQSVGMSSMGYMKRPGFDGAMFDRNDSGTDEITQLLRDGADISEIRKLQEERSKKLKEELERSANKTKKQLREEMEQEFLNSMSETEIDHGSVEADYRRLKQLITADYGPPDTVDGPLVEDPEYLEAIAEGNSDTGEDSMDDLKSTIWTTPTTQIHVSVNAIPFGGRLVLASLMSVVHGHHFPGHADFGE